MPLDTVGHAVKEVGGHLLRRIGTAFSATLIAMEIPPELVSQLIITVGALAGVVFDISLAIYAKRRWKAAVRAKCLQKGEDQCFR